MSIRTFYIRLCHWEFWPFGLIQFPVFILWFIYGIRQRALFYFSASNPGIPTGGMMGESKFEILQKLPEAIRPVSILFQPPFSREVMESAFRNANLSFPVIFKPDVGERGRKVKRINNWEEAEKYAAHIRSPFIAQEFLNLPLEYGVFYKRYPCCPTGEVFSITGKSFLTVVGDGKSTIEELVKKNPRARLQKEKLETQFSAQWHSILPKEERVELVSIGNHCLGTTFLNCNSLITPVLNASFDKISQQIDGFFYGRFDLRCHSTADLEQGRVKVMELNGCGAEPAHIYQPGFPLWKGIWEVVTHWRTIYKISVENHKRGVPYLSFKEGLKIYRHFKEAMQ